MLARLTLHLHAAVARTSRSSRSVDLDIVDAMETGVPTTRDLEMLDIVEDSPYRIGHNGDYISAEVDSPIDEAHSSTSGTLDYKVSP